MPRPELRHYFEVRRRSLAGDAGPRPPQITRSLEAARSFYVSAVRDALREGSSLVELVELDRGAAFLQARTEVR